MALIVRHGASQGQGAPAAVDGRLRSGECWL